MNNSNYQSIGGYFVFDRNRSNCMPDNYFYRYLVLPKQKEEQAIIYLIVEQNEISFKQEKLCQNDTSVEFENLLVIPRNTEHQSFIEIKTQLIRLIQEESEEKGKQSEQKAQEEQQKRESAPPYKKMIKHFIEDLYINKYFKECGDSQSIRSSIEHIPLLQGIKCNHLFNYFFNKLEKEDKVKQWQLRHYQNLFEDAYLNYSKFLAIPNHEKLFHKNKWFENDIDKEIFITEQKYLKIQNTSKKSNFLFDSPLNVNNILKRYGILNVLNLGLPKWLNISFITSLIVFVFAVFADIASFNLSFVNSNFDFVNVVSKYILAFSFIAILIISLLILILNRLKSKLKLFPGILLPRLIIAIFSGWIIFFTAEEVIKIDIDLNATVLLGLTIFILIVTHLFMISEIRNYAPAMLSKNVFYRSLIVAALAFFVSYSFGFFGMTHINNKFLQDTPLVKEFEIKFDERNLYLDDIDILIDKKEQEINANINLILETCNPNNCHPIDTIAFTIKEDSFSKIEDININDDVRNKCIQQLNSKISAYNVDLLTLYSCDSVAYLDHGNFTCYENYKSKMFQKVAFTKSDIVQTDLSKLQHLESAIDYFPEYIAENREMVINDKKLHASIYKTPIGNWITFPNMLLARSILAMFVGIFLQLIIQDKTITEPI